MIGRSIAITMSPTSLAPEWRFRNAPQAEIRVCQFLGASRSQMTAVAMRHVTAHHSAVKRRLLPGPQGSDLWSR
jgi:hypothetical protein